MRHQIRFGLFKRPFGQFHHSTVGAQQKGRRKDTPTLSLRFSSLDGFQCHGVQGELQAMLVEDGRLVVALRDGVGRLRRYGLEWMALEGSSD